MKSKFEQWFKQQPFYLNLRFIHGDQIFTSENSVYRVLAVQIAWMTWQEQQKRIDKALRVLLDSSPTMISKKAIKILKGGDE